MVTLIPQLSPSSMLIPIDRIEVSTVTEFVRDVRPVIADPAGEDTLLRWVQAHARGAADKFLGSYYEHGIHNPNLVAKAHSIAVTVTSLVPIAPHSWQVRFVERYFDHHGFRISDMADTRWIARLHTQINAVPSHDLRNPAGIYVTAIQWSEEASQQ